MDNSPSSNLKNSSKTYRPPDSKVKFTKTKSSITSRDIKPNLKKERLPRNVNDYKHIIHGSMKNEASLQWVLKLRNDAPLNTNRNKTVPHAPSFYDSAPSTRSNIYSESCPGTHFQNKRFSVMDVESVNHSSNEVMHLARHRLGVPANQSQLAFETGLRGYSALETAPKLPEWNNLPYKDRAHDTSICYIDPPQFLPPLKSLLKSNNSKSTGSLLRVPQQTESAFEGQHVSMPVFDDTASYKHASENRHLFVPGAKVSTINWQVSLRG